MDSPSPIGVGAESVSWIQCYLFVTSRNHFRNRLRQRQRQARLAKYKYPFFIDADPPGPLSF